jgi:hypothetical protein
MRLIKSHFCLTIHLANRVDDQKKQEIVNHFSDNDLFLQHFHRDSFEARTGSNDYDVSFDDNTLFLELKPQKIIAGAFEGDSFVLDEKVLSLIIKVLSSSPHLSDQIKVKEASFHGLAFVDSFPKGYMGKVYKKLFGKTWDGRPFGAEFSTDTAIDGVRFGLESEIQGNILVEEKRSVEYITLERTFTTGLEAPVGFRELYNMSLLIASKDFLLEMYNEDLPDAG